MSARKARSHETNGDHHVARTDNTVTWADLYLRTEALPSGTWNR
jgi:hypothetical protein